MVMARPGKGVRNEHPGGRQNLENSNALEKKGVAIKLAAEKQVGHE